MKYTIKPLKWKKEPKLPYFYAACPFGMYYAWDETRWHCSALTGGPGFIAEGTCKSQEEGKAKCQADYEKRMRKWLQPAN